MNIISSAAKGKDTKSFLNPFLRGISLSYAVTAIIFMIFALLLTYTDISEMYIPMVSSAVTAFSCFIGGIATGYGAKEKGLIFGVILAIFYMVIMFLIGNFSKAGETLPLSELPVIVMALASGGIGGIVGVNKSN